MASCQIDYVRFLEPKITLVLFPESIPSLNKLTPKLERTGSLLFLVAYIERSEAVP